LNRQTFAPLARLRERGWGRGERQYTLPRTALLLLTLFAAPFSLAADPLSLPAFNITPGENGAQEYSVNLQVLLLMTALGFIPAFIMLMTSFTRIIIVLSILRQALGLQQTPSNPVLLGLSLFLTLFIMAPVFEQINKEALHPKKPSNAPKCH